MEKRLTDLEVRYTYLERHLEELSQVVFDQRKQLDRLQQEVLGLRSRLLSLTENAPNERPPHY